MNASQHPADKLAEIRYWKSKLEQLDQQLVRQIVADPALREGAQTLVELRKTQHFCKERLPDFIQRVPNLWQETQQVEVVAGPWVSDRQDEQPEAEHGAEADEMAQLKVLDALKRHLQPENSTWFSVATDEFRWLKDAK